MTRNTKIVKKIAALFLVLFLSIDSFAAVVSDNDGSAFVTKGEFEALKLNFATQVANYNESIDNKIDGAIASYLSGLRLSTTNKIKTGFDVQGIDNAVNFYGRGNDTLGGQYPTKTETTVFTILTTGYSASDWWMEDTQHAFAWKATWKYTDSNYDTTLIERENNYITRFLTNPKVTERIFAAGYGASNWYFWYGGTWGKLKITIPEPSEDRIKYGLPTNTTWPFEREFYSYGLAQFTTHSASAAKSIYTEHHDNYGTRPDGLNGGTKGNCVWITGEENCTSSVKCADAAYSLNWNYDKADKFNYHWPWGANLQQYVKPIIRESDGTIKEKSNYIFLADQTFTNTILINSLTGTANADWESYSSGVWPDHPVVLNDTKGSVAILNASPEDINNLYYRELKDTFDTDERISHGFLVTNIDNAADGYVELNLKSDTINTKLFFSKDNFGSTIDVSQYLDCDFYNEATGTWDDTKSPILSNVAKTYKIRVKFSNDAKKIFLAVAPNNLDIGNFRIKLTQVGDAEMVSS